MSSAGSTGEETQESDDDLSLNALSVNHNNQLFAGAVEACVDALANVDFVPSDELETEHRNNYTKSNKKLQEEDKQYLLADNNEYAPVVADDSANLWSKAMTTIGKGKGSKGNDQQGANVEFSNSSSVINDGEDDGGQFPKKVAAKPAFDMGPILMDESIDGGQAQPFDPNDKNTAGQAGFPSDYSLDGESAMVWGDEPEKAYFAYMLEKEAEQRAIEGKDPDDSLVGESVRQELLNHDASTFADGDSTTLGNGSKAMGWDRSTAVGASGTGGVSTLTPSHLATASQEKRDKDGKLMFPSVIYVQDGTNPSPEATFADNKQQKQPRSPIVRTSTSKLRSNSDKNKTVPKQAGGGFEDPNAKEEPGQEAKSGWYTNRILIGFALFFLILTTGLVAALIVYRNNYAEETTTITDTSNLDESEIPVMPPTKAPVSRTFTPTFSIGKKDDTTDDDANEDDTESALPVVETPSPSTAPSTTAPTWLPTGVPSFEPTWLPTGIPTFQQSQKPSRSPTNAPTNVPSSAPSFVPTRNPSIRPSEIASGGPTQEPSIAPSEAPTSSQVPSIAPSEAPSASQAPSQAPSLVPSLTPSEAPTTGEPTGAPTRITLTPPAQNNTSVPLVDVTVQQSNENNGSNETISDSNTIIIIDITTVVDDMDPVTISPNVTSDGPGTTATSEPSFTPTNRPNRAPTAANATAGSPSTSDIVSKPTLTPTTKPSKAPITKMPSTKMPSTNSTSTKMPSSKMPLSKMPLSKMPSTKSPTTAAPSKAPPTTAPTSAPVVTTAPTRPPSNHPTAALTKSPTGRPTAAPTNSPQVLTSVPTSPVPTHVSLETVRAFLLVYSPMSTPEMFDQESVQFEALQWLAQWMASIPTQELGRITKKRLVQRWTLAVLYLSMNGPNWASGADDWMGDGDICDWLTNNGQGNCDLDDLVSSLDLSNNNLRGSLPKEISLLTSMMRLEMDRNDIVGPIPAQFSRLQGLVTIDFTRCDLTGTLPGGFGSLSDLAILGLGRNDFKGTIPTDFGRLQNLVYLGLERNDLSGRIPVELASLANLEYLAMDWNALTGEVPAGLSNLNKLRTLILARNMLVGKMPGVFCDRTMDFLAADCDEVTCTCCDLCCVSGQGCAST